MDPSQPPAPAKPKWYWRTGTLVIALLSVGPLALPLLWFNPRFGWKAKVVWSIIVVVLIVLLGRASQWALDYLLRAYGPLLQQTGQ